VSEIKTHLLVQLGNSLLICRLLQIGHLWWNFS